MRELFASGRAIDIVLAFVALEAALLLGLRRWRRGALGLVDLIGQLLPGALLLLAVRCALTGADYRLTAVLITASLPAHLLDLLRRTRGGARPADPAAATP